MKTFTSLFFLFIFCFCCAQTDSTIVAKPVATRIIKSIKYKPKPIIIDTTNTKLFIDSTKDSAAPIIIIDSINSVNNDSLNIIKQDSLVYHLLLDFPILNNSKPELMLTIFREPISKDGLFYLLLSLVVLLAIINLVFPKYIKNVFTIITQTKYRQIQTREQLVQDNIASMMLNILFTISTAIFIALLLTKYHLTKFSFWQILFAATVSLICIYLFKFFFTKFLGWIFNKSTAANAYNFIVFIINKIWGVLVIPISFIVAFSSVSLSQQAFNAALIILATLLLFRLYLTYKNISNILKINAIHFFLYFCGIEILPLLLMYKTFYNYIGNGI